MKSKIRRLSVVSLLALSSFTFSSVIQPVTAHAIIGAAAWPLFPLVIIGAALEGAAVVTEGVSISQHCHGYHVAAARNADISLGEFLLGLLFLDDSTGGTVQEITQAQAIEYKLTLNELQTYNHAVRNGQIEEILESATQELNRSDASFALAKEVMQDLLAELPIDAHTAFTKISQHIVKTKSNL